MGPRYDANHDALQCVHRNGTACANCANRIAFIGKRGEKGAWNKPCKGAKRPDPDGHNRKRCTYGGHQIAGHQLLDEVQREELDVRGQVDYPTAHGTSLQGRDETSPPFEEAASKPEDDGTCDTNWFNMAE